MERRRLFLFCAISLAIMIGWTQFVIPLLNRAAAPPNDPAGQAAAADAAEDNAAEDGAADNPKPAAGKPNEVDGVVQTTDGNPKTPENGNPNKDNEQPDGDKKNPKLPNYDAHPPIKLGSLDPKTGYFAEVQMAPVGGGVERFTLNDPRYKSLDEPLPNKPRDQLTLVRPVKIDGRTVHTLDTEIPQFDAFLKKFNVRLSEVVWDVPEKVTDKDGKEFPNPFPDPNLKGLFSSVTYVYKLDNPKLEIRKKYTLEPIAFGDRDPQKVRDSEARGYQLKFELTIVNHGDQPQQANYVLQGPVGLPLENRQHTSIYRSVQDGALDPAQKALPPAERDVELVSVTADDVVEQVNDKALSMWKAPLRYIGVDVQYFAALLIPVGDQLKNPYVSVAQPVLIDIDKDDPDQARAAKDKFRDISVTLTSITFNLKPGEEVTHSYTLFAGPKRAALLESFGAADVIEYGWFGVVSKLMLSMMKFMHDVLYLPYGIAIIFLTIIVRGCMYPISRKQAAGAKKMKELQPKIAELKKKYENEKEKFARAQMELFSKHNYNPLAGCLPIVLQLPIFIGLYQALRNAVDLRLTPFPLTWIDNLAAPDALFKLPFDIPFGLGSDFNLLPLLTVALFVVQQKLFMPPPIDEQQALQHKMMNFMMIFMGFMFYHVPAGLCVYFIASSLWGIGERKMLDYGKPAGDAEKKADDVETETPDDTKKAKAQAEEQPARKGFMQRLFEAADAAGQASQLESQSNGQKNGNGRGGRKKRKKSRR